MGINEYAQKIAWCQNCKFVTREGWCDYIGWNGHRRPCKPGTGCTARVLVEGERHRKGWVDRDRLAELYKQGLTDREIAEQTPCGIATVVRWRVRGELPPNKKARNPKTEKKRGPKIVVDREKIAALYAQGLTDREILEQAGCSWASVSRWRKSQGLPPNQKEEKKEVPT